MLSIANEVDLLNFSTAHVIFHQLTSVSGQRFTGLKRETGIRNFFMPEPRKEGNKILFWVSGINLRIGVVTKIVLLESLFPILRKYIPLPRRVRLRR